MIFEAQNNVILTIAVWEGEGGGYSRGKGDRVPQGREDGRREREGRRGQGGKENEKEDKEDDCSDDETDDESVKDEEIIEENYFKITSGFNNHNQNYKNNESTIVDILCDKKFEREGKISELIRSLRNNFPALEGDKVTFIGSTFLKYGENDPYLG